MSKSTLLQHLSTKGKTHSWEDLARIHGLKTGEIARHTFRKSAHKYNTIPPNTGIDNSKQKEEILDTIRKEMGMTKEITYKGSHLPKKGQGKGLLLELAIFDLHMGKLAYDKETGEDYDLDIAVKRYNETVTELLSRVDPDKIERILLPIGNDMVNVDNKQNTTTAGTPQSSDSRFSRMFQMTKKLVIDTINRLIQIAPVDVVVIPGNHDEATMFTLGEVIDAYYHTTNIVTVSNSPKLRKYYQYGKNMIMFTHGDKEKIAELGLIAAHEEAKMWGNTIYREVHIGHFHKQKTINYATSDEYPGFKIRILPSLSSTDAWHYGKGFLSQHAAKAFLWDFERGMITEHTYNVS